MRGEEPRVLVQSRHFRGASLRWNSTRGIESSAVQPSSAGGGSKSRLRPRSLRGLCRGGARAGTPTDSRMAQATDSSSIAASSRIVAPQRGQRSASIAKTRCSNSAQCRRRLRAPTDSLSVTWSVFATGVVPSSSLGTTRLRRLAAGARMPW